MPRKRKIPQYVHHKPSGQARVRINGNDIYLGEYGTATSHARYDDAIATWLAESEAQVNIDKSSNAQCRTGGLVDRVQTLVCWAW